MAKKTAKTPTKTAKTAKKPTKRKRKSHVTRPTKAEQLKISQRRELVGALAETGLSIRLMSKHLISQGFKEASPATVHSDLAEELKESAGRRVQNADHLAELEIRKVDKWEYQLNMLIQKLNEGEIYSKDIIEDKVKIIMALHKNQNQRDRFQQISKREKSKTSAREALAKLMGVDPEQLPQTSEKE